MDPLVSVIVPIYNVEPWVRKCLESLKNQSLSQIEVIMVEDGSTDGSGRIAEEYVSDEWPIFRLIRHGENRGLSAARNTGIDEARSSWIMFVDSDDWVEPDFCETPYKAAIENYVDVVIFGFLFEGEWKNERKLQQKQPIGIVDEFTAHEYGSWAVWNKLYRKQLFDDARYPEGSNSEDVAMTHKFVHKANQIMMVQDTLYHYLFRKDGISNTHTLANRRDYLSASIERYNDFVSFGYPEDRLRGLYGSMCGAAIGYLACGKPDNDENDGVYLLAKQIVDSTKEMPKNITRKQKKALRAWKIDSRIFYLLSRVSGRLHS